LAFFFASRLFVFVSVTADTLVWKGMWELLDNLDDYEVMHTVMSNVIMVIVLAIILMCTLSFNACHCSTVGVGYYIDIDKTYLVSLLPRIRTKILSNTFCIFFLVH
jgi:hypothetical protein